MKRNRFGCPPTLARKELIICPFLPSSVSLNPWGSTPSDTDNAAFTATDSSLVIPSSLSSNPTTRNGNGNDVIDTDNGSQNGASTDSFYVEKTISQLQSPPPPSTLSYDLLTPALLSPEDWPFSMSQLFELALGPPNLSYTPT